VRGRRVVYWLQRRILEAAWSSGSGEGFWKLRGLVGSGEGFWKLRGLVGSGEGFWKLRGLVALEKDSGSCVWEQLKNSTFFSWPNAS
jgi:hypothetical protein